ncbi:MAG: helix-turn-helix transcriptional regulator, partial [Candidatus Poribacteria bacterium]|nr:helix-turn-helix transcriptional regulator [Candidatus Poribacteria bacterium]
KFNHDLFRKAVRGEMTQVELAAKLGLPPQNVSRLLRRGNQMKVEHLEMICKAIGRNPTEFFSEGENEACSK